jgi:hypothetical protein
MSRRMVRSQRDKGRKLSLSIPVHHVAPQNAPHSSKDFFALVKQFVAEDESQAVLGPGQGG